jgi:2-methylaconitate cis-trans-isomerase PrpF
MGSGKSNQLDGIGGGFPTSSKVCIVAPFKKPQTNSTEAVSSTSITPDVTYHFRQCEVSEASIDESHGDCGNMIAGVGVFAILRQLAKNVCPKETGVIVMSENTNKFFELVVQTPNGLLEAEMNDTGMVKYSQLVSMFSTDSFFFFAFEAFIHLFFIPVRFF